MELCNRIGQMGGIATNFDHLSGIWLRGVLFDYEFVYLKDRLILLTRVKSSTVTQFHMGENRYFTRNINSAAL